jgi:hypothetical protein
LDAITNAAVAANAAQASIPLPSGIGEIHRVQSTRSRRAMLEGTWSRLLAERSQQVLGATREAMQADPSLSLNPFKSVCRALSVLYDGAPTIQHAIASADDLRNLTRKIAAAGLWPMMQRVQQYTLGLREMMVHAAVDPATGALRFRAVYPDMVYARASEDRPDEPVRIEELRARSAAYLRSKGVAVAPNVQNADDVWTVDVYDISGPTAFHAVHLLGGAPTGGQGWAIGADITGQLYGAPLAGEAYPWRATPTQAAIEAADGETPLGAPVLPYVLYHAAPNGDRIWDPYEWIEIVDGTLTVGVLNGFLLHTFAEASWPQKYIIGGAPVGAAVTMDDGNSGERRAYIPSDPTSILIVEPLPGFVGQPSAAQFQPGGDIAVQEQVLGNMVSALMESAGISPSDVQRLSGNARSGAAIALTNEGKRELQRRYQAVFEASDQRLVRLCAILLNRYSDTLELAAEDAGTPIPTRYRFPEGGYSLTYPRIPRSPDELKAHREHVFAMLDRGMLTDAEAFAALHDVPLDVAERRVTEIAERRAAPQPSAPAPTPAPRAAMQPPQATQAPAPASAPARDLLREAIEDALDEIDDGGDPAAALADLRAMIEDDSEDVLDDATFDPDAEDEAPDA